MSSPTAVFDVDAWKPALVAAGVIPERQRGERYASAREHGMHALRHFYASVLLDAGESVKAVSEYLGHADPALTLRVYAHLMPSSQARTRRAVDAVFRYPSRALTARGRPRRNGSLSAGRIGPDGYMPRGVGTLVD